MKGHPDIKDDKFIGIKVKTEKGKLSFDQVEFGRECVRSGGECILAGSIRCGTG